MIFSIKHAIVIILTILPLSVLSAEDKLTDLENLVVDNFEQFCLNNINNPQKTISEVKAKGFQPEENEYLKPGPGDYRWVVYADDKTYTRVNLLLTGNNCMISAITDKEGKIHNSENQSPIERLLINKIGAELVSRDDKEKYEERVFDSNYQGHNSTIILKNEVSTSQTQANTFFYEVIMTVIPR